MPRTTGLLAFYSVSLLLVFHSFLVAYSNSSYLEQYIGSEHVGAAYLGASALTVFMFLFISYILRSVGNYRITMMLLALDGIAVSGLALTGTASLIVPLLLIHITVIPLIFFNLDVFLEGMIGNNEHTTGSKRGLLLAISSFIGAVSPLLSGFLIEARGFAFSYLIAAIALVPVAMILIFYFRSFSDPVYHEIRVLEAIRSFWVRHDIRMVFSAHLLLQIFFCFMVVYAPLYLATVIGLSWSEIGIVLFAAQLAYVFLEYPIGYVADHVLGEQEMMATGFVILAVATATLAAIDTTAMIPWMLAMFATRVGAALVEVTTESYFFKHMRSSDAQIISFFRLTRPLSYVIGALIGTATLFYLPFGFVFIAVGFLMTAGIVFALQLTDTK